MVNKPLNKALFLGGGTLGGGWLTSHKCGGASVQSNIVGKMSSDFILNIIVTSFLRKKRRLDTTLGKYKGALFNENVSRIQYLEDNFFEGHPNLDSWNSVAKCEDLRRAQHQCG